MSDQNYMSVGPMFFTSIDQMIEFLKHLSAEEAIEVLKETKKQGYDLHPISNMIQRKLTSEDFEKVEQRGCDKCYFDKSCNSDQNLLDTVRDKLGSCYYGYIFKLKSK